MTTIHIKATQEQTLKDSESNKQNLILPTLEGYKADITKGEVFKLLNGKVPKRT